jgi:hypothetical protein
MNCFYYAFLADSETSTELTIICKKARCFMYRRAHGYRDTEKTSTSKTRFCVKPYELHINRDSTRTKKNYPMGSMSFSAAPYVEC